MVVVGVVGSGVVGSVVDVVDSFSVVRVVDVVDDVVVVVVVAVELVGYHRVPSSMKWLHSFAIHSHLVQQLVEKRTGLLI